MKKIFLVITLLIFSKSFAIVGLADWQCKTSYGNTFDNYSGGGITLFVHSENGVTEIKGLQKWYFYKGFIIGENNESNKLSYFFVNEKNKKVYNFENKQEAIKFKTNNKLIPFLWTRWFNDDFETTPIFFLFNAFVVVFLIYHLISILYKLIKKRKIYFGKDELAVYKILFVIFILVTFFDNNKNSF